MNFHLLLKNLLTIICFFMYNIKKHKGVIILKTDRLFKFAKEMPPTAFVIFNIYHYIYH